MKKLLFIFFILLSNQALAGAPSFIQESETVWNTTGNKTTGSFSVVSGDVLVAFTIDETNSAQTISDSTSTSANWSLKQQIIVANYTSVSIWTKAVTTTESMTVTFTAGASGRFGGNVLTFRGSDGAGASAKDNQATGQPQRTITTTQANSVIVSAWGDWAAVDGATRDYLTGAGAFTEQTYNRTVGAYSIYGGWNADSGSIGTYTVGSSTVPTGQKWSIVAVEVKGTAGGGGGSTIHSLGALGVGN